MNEETSHPALRPLNPEANYWAIMSWAGLVTARALEKIMPIVLRYQCKDAREIVITPHIKTFIYFCHASKTWDIHEISTGIRLVGGGSITQAFANAQQFFKAADEQFFFEQMRAMGSCLSHKSVVPYETAMQYLQVGEEKDKWGARARHRRMLKV